MLNIMFKPWKDLSLYEKADSSYKNYRRAVMNNDEKGVKKWRNLCKLYLFELREQVEKIDEDRPLPDII